MNEKIKKLFDLARAKIEEAKAVIDDQEKFDELMTEAGNYRDQAERLQKTVEFETDLSEPVINIPLPSGTDGKATPTVPQEDPPEDDASLSPTYVLRYGEDAPAVKAVLIDLHGPDFAAKRIAQWKAFNRYLRNYSYEPSGADYELLKEVIITPEYAAKAIETGMDIEFVKSTMVEAIDTLGGYVVPVDFQTSIIKRLRGLTVMRQRAAVMSTSRDRVQIPKMTGGDDQYTTAVRVTWVSETPTAGTADTNLTLGMEDIPVHDVMAETFLSRNVVDDSAVNLVSELTTAFAEAAAIDEDNQFLTGDGVGKPRGILIGGTALETGVTAVNSGNATAITADGLIDLEYGIPTQYRQRCGYIENRTTVRNKRKLKASDGTYLWERRTIMGEPDTFDGYPIWEQEVMPDIAASAYPILFGDPSGYRIVDRLGMTVERYLDSSTARQNLVLYIMRRRLGGQLTHPERWRAQLISA